MVKHNKKLKTRKNAWFKKIRGSYLPINQQGWFTYLPFIAYLAFAFIAGIKDTSNASKAVLFIVPNWVAAAVVMTFVASRKS
jgi:hypothetical protein